MGKHKLSREERIKRGRATRKRNNKRNRIKQKIQRDKDLNMEVAKGDVLRDSLDGCFERGKNRRH